MPAKTLLTTFFKDSGGDNVDIKPEIGDTVTEHKMSTEMLLMRNDPETVNPIKNICIRFKCMRKSTPQETAMYKADGFNRILECCSLLEFNQIKYKLLEFFTNRLEHPGCQATTPSMWDSGDLHVLIDSIGYFDQVIRDAKIHKAFIQIRFYLLVRPDVSIFIMCNGKDNWKEVLNGLADSKSGEVSKNEKAERRRKYLNAYNAGEHWWDISRWFGGPAVIFLFVCAGKQKHASRTVYMSLY